MRRFFPTIIALCLASPAAAQSSDDPYAETYKSVEMAHIAQAKLDLLAKTEHLFFGVGCKAIPSIGTAAAVQGWAFNLIMRAHGILTGDFFAEIRDAEKAGLLDASKPNYCDYWKEHPEEVHDLRDEISTYNLLN